MTAVTRARKAPRRITAQCLDRVALAYLQRFASSAQNLRRVLMRRVERSARAHGDDPAGGAALVDALIERYRAAGLLDDRVYAEAKAESLRRRGDSGRAIRAKLALKGVDRDLASTALEQADGESPDAEMAAAVALARRRGLGPYRKQEERAEVRTRDLAALARAGFSYDVAQRVVDTDDPEGLMAG
jgi:regulatory protein